ncbi:MAG: Y-family DNA polymerase [Ktedonobacteraceae bacterium]|nr:Y-family DNA polymerase [Ktedonobacteraceae bacterium]
MRQNVVALVDCVSFYVAVERIFHPSLYARPLIVLSNNDGNIVASSAEAQAIGLTRGMPYSHCRTIMKRHGVAVFSSNLALYQDLSERVMRLLGEYAEVRNGRMQQEVYSIDECFLSLGHVPPEHLLEYTRRMQAAILQKTGISTRVGIATTKILAKIAALVAKRDAKHLNVVNLADVSEREIDAILATVALEEIWGIGKQRARRLEEQDMIFTAEMLKYRSPTRIRTILGVVGERVTYELRGIACLPLEIGSKTKKGILTSRSFGRPIESCEELAEAIAHYTAIAAAKVRRQGSQATSLSIFVGTNPFDAAAPQYTNGASQRLAFPTDFTPDLIAAALALLREIYQPGFQYKRAGVHVTEMRPHHVLQPDLFGAYSFEREAKKARLMAIIDLINATMRHDVIWFGSQGIRRPWQAQARRRSLHYTTRWAEILSVH